MKNALGVIFVISVLVLGTKSTYVFDLESFIAPILNQNI